MGMALQRAGALPCVRSCAGKRSCCWLGAEGECWERPGNLASVWHALRCCKWFSGASADVVMLRARGSWEEVVLVVLVAQWDVLGLQWGVGMAG